MNESVLEYICPSKACDRYARDMDAQAEEEMNKWTPGPWRAQQFAGEWLVWGNGKGRAVAYQVEERNARLIAAAPELHEALRKLTAAVVMVEWDNAPPSGEVSWDQIESARALLARIRGE